ncbi:MAG TPA: hypothetical protein VGR88_07030, partial [Ktedonobacterales bacterium]|nr:hypothetical protein [Ktedonobacterales bacterium]
MDAIFFASPDELRAWFAAHHETASELFVGFYKKGTGVTSVTYKDAVDQALCFGWIDSVLRSIDATRYCIRFTPRKAASNWSEANIRRVAELVELGLMDPAGLRAYARRKPGARQP